MNNSDKIILDLCGGTGSWSKPYVDVGYDVRLVTLPENDVRDYIPPENVYGVLAAPPCDQFSIARNRYESDPNVPPRDIIGGMATANACMRIIFQCNPLAFWGLEQPGSSLMWKYIKSRDSYFYSFDPWWFGDPWSKRTKIMGRFNIPQRIFHRYADLPNAYTLEGTGYKILAKRRYTARKDGIPSIADITSGSQKEERAKTPEGFARAFFEVNR